MTEERQHNIPQLINFSLATGLVVTVSDAVQNLVQEARPEDAVGPTNFILLALMFAVAVKVFMDEHDILAEGKIRPILVVDVIFLVSSYCTLIAACTLVRNFAYSVMLVGYYFALLALWNLTAIILDWSRAPLQIQSGKRRIILVWLLLDVAGVLLAIVSHLGLEHQAEFRWVFIVGLAGLLILDFHLSPTLSYRYATKQK